MILSLPVPSVQNKRSSRGQYLLLLVLSLTLLQAALLLLHTCIPTAPVLCAMTQAPHDTSFVPRAALVVDKNTEMPAWPLVSAPVLCCTWTCSMCFPRSAVLAYGRTSAAPQKTPGLAGGWSRPVPGCWQQVGWSVLHVGGGWHSISPALHGQGEPAAGPSVPNSPITDTGLPF